MIAQLVGFIEYHERRFFLFEGENNVRHHFRNGAARRINPHTLQEFRHKVLAVPVLGAREVIHVAVACGITLDRLAFTASGITRDCEHEGIVLRVLQKSVHAFVAACLHDNPRTRIVADLRGDRAPHFLAD